MGTIVVNPGALMDYADWVRPKVLRVDTAGYDSAMRMYLAAANDFGAGGVHNVTAAIEVELKEAERHNLVAESFAAAIESLDGDKAFRNDGTVAFTLDHASFMGMRAAWRHLGTGTDLVEEAEDLQAEQYANDVKAVLADDDLGDDDRREAIEALLADLSADGIDDDPSAQEAFVLTLGGQGLWDLSEAAWLAESNGHDGWLGPITQVSTYVATTANRLSASRLRDFVGEMPGSVLFMNARLAPWDDAATTIAVEHLWDDDDWPMTVARWPASFVDTMGAGSNEANWEALPTTWRAAAAGLLADNPAVAHDFLTATSDEGRERLRDMVYDVDHALAGEALVAGLRDHPGSLFDAGDRDGEGSLAFQQAFAETEDAFAWLMDHHETTDDGWFNTEDAMTDPSRVALAHVGGLFLDDLAFIVQNQAGGSGRGAFAQVSLGDATMFYDQLFDSTAAQQVTSAQLGAYTAAVWTDTTIEFRDENLAREPGEEQLGLQDMSGSTAQIDNLSNLFMGALEDDGAKKEEVASFWIGAGEATAGALAAIGLAATPLTGGASTVAGAGAAWTISAVADQVPIPEFDAEASSVNERQQASQTAIRVLLAYPEVLDRSHGSTATPYGLAQEDLDTLRGDALWEDLNASDTATREAAITRVNEIIVDNGVFRDAVLDLTGELRWADENA